MPKLSVAIATYNEAENIAACLESVKDIASQIVIIDGSSTDDTVAIAKKHGAYVIVTENHKIFHINKQKALEQASEEWILQLDADERITPELAAEIQAIIAMTPEEIDVYQHKLPHRELFLRHQQLLELRDGNIGTDTGPYVAFFIPRRNYFLGKYLRFGGVYPDGVIRLVKKGHAHFPAKDVHEQIAVDGRVGWLEYPLLHRDSPTFARYIQRNNRYIALLASDLHQHHAGKNLETAFSYLVSKPLSWFFTTQVRHKGILDGWQGVVFSFFSSLRFPRAYLIYLKGEKK